MNALIIEDDEAKAADIKDVLLLCPCVSTIKIATSYSSGLKIISRQPIDFLVLDMTLPLYDEGGVGGGGRKVQYGGELLMQEMVEENFNQKVIVVSQHDHFADFVSEINLRQLDERLRIRFPEHLVSTILYDSSQFEVIGQGWRKQLIDAIEICHLKMIS